MFTTCPTNFVYYNLTFYLSCIYVHIYSSLLLNLINIPLLILIFNKYITFSHSVTRSSSKNKLLYLHSSCNIVCHFYFCRLPRLWNALPQIKLNSPINSIKHQIYGYLWNHFTAHLIDYCSCTFQLVCPCNIVHINLAR